ncbi:MAG: MYXO-CTERM sorting domain-containing protein, partial [Myxococcota bacterium]
MVLWVLSAASVAGAQEPFPDEDIWQALTVGGVALDDAVGDLTVSGADPSLDLSGAVHPAAAWWADDAAVYLRLVVTDDPDGFAGSWGFLVDTDGDDANFEYAISVDGYAKALSVLVNVAHADGVWMSGVAPVGGGFGSALDGATAVVELDLTGYAIELQLSRADLGSTLQVGDAQPLRFAAFSTPYWPLELYDLGGCDGGAVVCDVLADVLSDPVTIDRDLDGATDLEEALTATDPDDGDTDDDGVLDGEDDGDLDADGTNDGIECDSDGDGVSDGTEQGIAVRPASTDLAGCFVPDADPGTTTDPGDPDSDGGGLADGQEDPDGDGAVDPWETDPLDPTDDVDADADGIPDELDDLVGAGPDADSDGDGVLDLAEGLGDTNGDGVPDFGDDDSDGDGILDATETDIDTDLDGTPDFQDLDADGDTILDADEGVADPEADGFGAFQDLDADGDTILDADEGAADGDADGAGDFLDVDSDGDGIGDRYEGLDDFDEDGVPDRHDLDSDDDGWSDADEGLVDVAGNPRDTDRDGDADFRDLDSDDDGRLDENELGDVDCDEVPDRIDDDHEDGFCDTGQGVPPVDTDEPLPGEVTGDPNPFASRGSFTGGACSVAPGAAHGAPWWATAVVALIWRRRQRAASRRAGLLIAAAATLAPPAASAQEVDAQRFSPSVDGGMTTRVEDAETHPLGAGGLGLLFDYADDPFVFRPDDRSDEVPVLSAVATAHLLAWYSLGPVQLGTEIPVHLFTDGYRVDTVTHLGDLRLAAKAKIVDSGPVALAPYLDLSLPTGAAAAWVGAGEPVFEGGGIATVHGDRLLASASVGGRSGTGEE